jgi:hypothetical protein
MKQSILALALCLTLFLGLSAATSQSSFEVESEIPSYSLEQASKYKWLSDMFRFWLDVILLGITGPFFWFASFFANCQECYVNYVTGFMNKKGLRLSYKYV